MFNAHNLGIYEWPFISLRCIFICTLIVIFMPDLVVRGGSLAFSLGGHFELSSTLLSFSARDLILCSGSNTCNRVMSGSCVLGLGFGSCSQ